MKIQALFLLSSGLTLACFSLSATINAQTVASPQQAARVVVRNFTVTNHVIAGDVVNNSPHLVRDVELLFQYHWLWKNEFKPGDESPGRAVYFRLNNELRSGESTSFTYTPEPSLPARNDGAFMVEVSVASFTEVIPQKPPDR
jgi:hypothetical protein